jgi:hypothetical protein
MIQRFGNLFFPEDSDGFLLRRVLVAMIIGIEKV